MSAIIRGAVPKASVPDGIKSGMEVKLDGKTIGRILRAQEAGKDIIYHAEIDDAQLARDFQSGKVKGNMTIEG